MEYLEFENKIKIAFGQFNIDVETSKILKFFDFMNLLIEKNKVMNLTSIIEPDEIIEKHFLDSCAILKKEIANSENAYTIQTRNTNCRVLDVGTGAGFPGLPLAIICENCNFVLTDTLGKRIKFLEEVVKILGINNVELIKSRAEDLGRDNRFREKFDLVVSRAVARMNILSEYTLPFVKIGGKLVCYKQMPNDLIDEVVEAKGALKTLGAKQINGMFHVEHKYKIANTERRLVIITKTLNTPSEYPRKAGIPERKPIT